jgi:hypothetical protein
VKWYIGLELNKKTEQPAQQYYMPQPPPPPPQLGACDEEASLPEPEQLKAESIFFTSLEAHFGHSVSAGSGYRL